MEYDIDNDYDIEQSEKDSEITNALQAVINSNAEKEKDKNKANTGNNQTNNNDQPINPQNNENPGGI